MIPIKDSQMYIYKKSISEINRYLHFFFFSFIVIKLCENERLILNRIISAG